MKRVILAALLPFCATAKFDFTSTSKTVLNTAYAYQDRIILGAGIAAIAYLFYNSFDDAKYAKNEIQYIKLNSDYIFTLTSKTDLSSSEKTAICDFEQSCDWLKHRISKVKGLENETLIEEAKLTIETANNLLSQFDMAAIKKSVKDAKPSFSKFSTLRIDQHTPSASGYCIKCDDWFAMNSGHKH